MKKCLSEIMKELKEVDRLIATSRNYIEEFAIIKYYDGEDVEKDINFNEKLNELDELYKKELKYKYILSNTNANTNLIAYDEEISISNGLIKLAILNRKLNFIKQFRSNRQIDKRLIVASYQGDVDRIQIIERLYDIKAVDEMIKDLSNQISKLQISIDKTNLLTEVDI